MDEVIHTETLTFRLDENNKLFAMSEPAVSKVTLDTAALHELLARHGLSDLYLNEQSLSRLVQMYNNTNAGFVLEIGERRDGEFIIKVSEDKMTAWLTMTPAYGGTPVTFDQIRQGLKEKGVISGLITAAEIESLLKEGHATDYVIAQGQPPVPGLDAQFHSLVPEMQEKRPQINARGIADFRDLGNLILVKKGAPLMRRTPPTEGKKGKNIHGKVLAPKPSHNTPFSPEISGAILASDDSNLLLAAIVGQPLLIPNGVMVSPTITVPQVDISTGNLSFDGTINILGDVMEGMKVYALNDIFIGGTVEAAEMEAGGNISIKGGAIGHGEPAGGLATSMSGKISCKGSVNVRFAKYATIEAGTSIVIEEYAMNSQLTAMNQILVGKPGGKKGLIIGGTARAMMLVQAASIGSSAGVKTYIQTGLNPLIQEQLNDIDREIAANEKNQEDITKIIAFVANNPEKNKNGLLDKAQRTLGKLTAELAQLKTDREGFMADMSFAEYAKIVAERGLFNGVEIRIGDKNWKAKEERGKTAFRLIDRKISFES